MQIVGIDFDHFAISSRNRCHHSTSPPHLSKTINSYYIVDLAITIYLENFHDIVTPYNVKKYPISITVSFFVVDMTTLVRHPHPQVYIGRFHSILSLLDESHVINWISCT